MPVVQNRCSINRHLAWMSNKKKMSQQWTNEYSILRDLSVAQGRVPVAIEGTVAVGAGDKPPSLNITEETEEEYFKHCSADADVAAAPDLGFIKKMLDMVRDMNVSSDKDDPNKVVVISKLNPCSTEFVPTNNNTSTPLESPKKEPKKPKKRQRNIALESILQSIADSKQCGDSYMPEPMKLLKPNDFICNNNISDEVPQKDIDQIDLKTEDNKPFPIDNISPAPTALEKVNGWLKTQTNSPFPKKTLEVTLQATNMFKKKTVTEKAKIVESTVKSPTSSNSGEYKPSRLANEYYKKYVERSKFKESVKDDIWTRAEKKMKEIEEKRRREAIQALASPSQDSESLDNTQSTIDNVSRISARGSIASAKINRCLDLVSLPQHRHLLTGECIVCKVMTKKPGQNDEKSIEKNDENLDISAENLMEVIENDLETETSASDVI